MCLCTLDISDICLTVRETASIDRSIDFQNSNHLDGSLVGGYVTDDGIGSHMHERDNMVFEVTCFIFYRVVPCREGYDREFE